jgi:spermidine synthase
LFAYLAACAPNVPTILGDARISLGNAPDQAYDLMILDAYSADYIPVHLITREALELYLRKLQPHGILAFHITNTWFELEWVLQPLARDLGLRCYVEHERYIKVSDAQTGKYPSDWLVLARNDSDLGSLAQDRRWQACPPSSFRLWTDDYSSLVTAIPVRISIGPQ